MTGMNRALAFASVFALSLAAAPAALAGEVGDQLRGRLDRVVQILEDPALKARPEARRTALRGAATEIFDFTEITRRSLGRHWQTATPAERDELVHLFTALLERSYVGRVEQFNGERVAVSVRRAMASWPPCARAWSARTAPRRPSTTACPAPATAGSPTTSASRG